jgi:putative FmdB family regulatory protein
MPFYTYRATDSEKSCETCIESYEAFQSIKSDPLTHCPVCGNPIVRIIHPVGKVEIKTTDKMLSDDNLKKHGFKKLVNVGDGKYDEVV